MLVNAIFTMKDEPFNILPMAGFTCYMYQFFMFSHKLMCAKSLKEADVLIEEMRTAEGHLNEPGLLGLYGFKEFPNLYTKLKDAGMHNLDEYLRCNDAGNT